MALEYSEPWLICKELRAEGSRDVEKVKVNLILFVSSPKPEGFWGLGRRAQS